MATYTGADKALAFLFEVAANLADDYDASATYGAGAYAIHEGTLYKCTSPISSPEPFTPAHWQAVLVMDEVAAGGGGGGGGTTVIANPAGAATDTLNKLQVASTIYSIPSGGGGSGHTFSTTEQIYGTWIDGSTVYEKTINFGALPNNASKTVNHGISNMGYLVQAFATGYAAIYNALPIPWVNNSSNPQDQLCLIVNSTGVIIRTGGNRSSYDTCYVTLRYLKTA